MSANELWSRCRFFLFWGVVIGFLVAVPLPQRRMVEGWLQPETVEHVYAGSRARVIECRVEDGDRVLPGDSLFVLHSRQQQDRLVTQQAAAQLASLQLASQQRERDRYGRDVDLSQYDSALQTARQMAQNAQASVARLHLQARQSGVFCVHSTRLPQDFPTEQPTSGYRVSPRQWLGCTVEADTLLGTIRGADLIAVLPLTDSQMADLAVGSRARVCLLADNSRVVKSTVDSVVRLSEVPELPTLSMHLATPGPDKGRGMRAGNRVQPAFAAIVSLGTDVDLPAGTQIRAALEVPSKTPFEWLYQWTQANLNLLAD